MNNQSKLESSNLKIQTVSIASDSQTLFLAPSETIFRNFRQAIEKRDGSKLVSRGFLADAIAWYSNDRAILAGPAIGESAISLTLRPFLSAGIKKVNFVGYAGAIHSRLGINDYLLPNMIYSNRDFENPLCFRATNIIPTKLYPAGSTIHIAPIISVVDPYETNARSLSRWRKLGVVAVEMELHRIAKLQQSYDFEVNAGLLISDQFAEDDTHTSKLSSSDTKSACRMICDKLVAAC